ncbi:hypothetical protein Tco_0408150 [Tanacetum coccineum]
MFQEVCVYVDLGRKKKREKDEEIARVHLKVRCKGNKVLNKGVEVGSKVLGLVVQYGVSNLWIRRILGWIRRIHFHGYGVSKSAVPGEVNPVHAYYNGSRINNDTEDPSWSTSFKTRRTRKTSSALEALWKTLFVLHLYLIGTLIALDGDDDVLDVPSLDSRYEKIKTSVLGSGSGGWVDTAYPFSWIRRIQVCSS